jgi:hypothetical protein
LSVVSTATGKPDTIELTNKTDAFDHEIRRALHQRLTLDQLLYLFFLVSLDENTERANHTFPNALLSSALYRAATDSRESRHLIRNRIKNCVLVAQHISSNHDSAHERELFRDFCDAASTSHCCWHYIFGLRYNVNSFVHHVDEYGIRPKEGELLLESALLVANGYQLTDVKRWFLRLGKLRMLIG